MTFGEALRLLEVLRADPSSAVAAALEGWDYPISRETLAMLDTFDLTRALHADPKKGAPKPHPGRPFKTDQRAAQRFGDTKGRSRAEVVEILNRLGHHLPV